MGKFWTNSANTHVTCIIMEGVSELGEFRAQQFAADLVGVLRLPLQQLGGFQDLDVRNPCSGFPDESAHDRTGVVGTKTVVRAETE